MPVRRHPIAVASPATPLSLFPVDRALVDRLNTTYAMVRVHDLRLAEVFYAKLFAAAPQLRAMFRGDMASQSQKLTAALDAVVRNFEKPDENAEMFSEMGKRHAGYGTKAKHYTLVIELLVESMQEMLGPGANAQSINEWRMALRLIANQMIAAADYDAASLT